MAKRGGGIDYSKWDKMDFSDDDDDDDDDDESNDETFRPRVTRLDAPSRVTRSADGAIEIVRSVDEDAEDDPSPVAPSSPRPAPPSPDGKTEGDGLAVGARATTEEADDESKKFTRNGGLFVDEAGASRRTILWSQDREEVIVTVPFDPERISSRDVRAEVSGAVPYSDRHCAVGGGATMGSPGGKRDDDGGEEEDGTASGGGGTLRVFVATSGDVLLEGNLPHRVHYAEGEDEVEYEIHTPSSSSRAFPPGSKLVRVTLRKAAPMAGVTVWWSTPLLGRPEIDVEKIEARQRNKGDDGGRQSRQEKMKEAWDEAHRTFKEKMKGREKVSLDLPEEA